MVKPTASYSSFSQPAPSPSSSRPTKDQWSWLPLQHNRQSIINAENSATNIDRRGDRSCISHGWHGSQPLDRWLVRDSAGPGPTAISEVERGKLGDQHAEPWWPNLVLSQH